MYKFALVLAIFVVTSHGKLVNIKNTQLSPLVVNVGDTQYTVAANGVLPVQLPDEWTGVLSAVPEAAEVIDGIPKTKVELSLSASGDTYSISLVDGFNLGVKVIPNGSLLCKAVVCNANILKVCPAVNQVTNSLGVVIGCQNVPLVMSARCPLAVVDISTVLNVRTCTDASSFLVIFI